MRSNAIETYKRSLTFSDRQREILAGLILGDGHIEKLYSPQLGRLKVEHGGKQKEYVDWLYEEFKDWVRTIPRARKRMVWGKIHTSYGFCTYGHRELGKFRNRFYRGRVKIVPRDIDKGISGLSLAVWYMDDGSVKSRRHKAIYLNTQGFTKTSVKRLQVMLEGLFGIASSMRPEKNGCQIYIRKEAAEKFIDLIRPYILDSMRYKIPRVLRLTELPKV